ncbi:MAG: glycosyltransferase family 2 protein [bacterium]|nr:glycosyltransferase family 2 protein [bacterium]
MYRKKKISIVIPAYKEEKLIKPTLENIPRLIDRIYVVDDRSPDNQNEVILKCAKKDRRIHLLRHKINQGPGASIITGYRQSSQDGYDITVVVGGDYQMPLHEVKNFLDPIIDGRVDYTKGNRFLLSRLDDTLHKMPKLRLVANWIITALTKIASGYYKVMDVVDGYTAISKRAVDTINWDKAWKGYGYPMDFLIRLNAYSFKVLDIPRTAIYLPGERQSQIKGLKYMLKVSPMLLRNFFWRLKFRYIYIDFHPLVFFYYLAFLLLPLGLGTGLYLVIDKIFLSGSGVSGPMSILASLLIITGFMFLFFAMLFDMQESQ